jgi:TRAP-type C4-dicarboxylate transport system permease small subunit
MERVALGLGRLATVALWLAGAALVAMTALIMAQVVFRYMLNSSIVWSEPAAVILMGWFIFLGAAVGIREGYHLSFEILLYVLSPRWKAVLHSISDLAVGGFGAGMIWFGGQLAWSAAGGQAADAWRVGRGRLPADHGGRHPRGDLLGRTAGPPRRGPADRPLRRRPRRAR